jgi:2-aminoadipate transaminase
MDEHGLRPDALRTVLQRHRPKLLYTIPLHHNPTAVSLPAARRDEVLELARAHDVVVLADEVYQLLHFDAANPPPAPFGARAAQGGVVSVGSFSKILAPAMRVGWIQADPDTVARFGRDGMIQSGGAINQIGSLLVRSVLRSGLQQAHLNELIAVLGRRARAMHEALVEHMPEGVHWTRPDGGYFFWLRYPPQVDTARLLAPAQALGAGFHPGARFSSAGGQSHCLRLSFARYDEGAIALGVQRLAQASAALMEAGG